MSALVSLPVAVRCLALDDAAVRTHTALRAHGIDTVLLKGAGLARRLAVERRYTDVDLLVAPADFDTAQDVLAKLGYRALMPGARADDWWHWHERAWLIPGPVPLAVDLHRGFAGVTDPEAFWTVVASSAEWITLAGGGTVAVPDETCSALLVALHAATPGRAGQPEADLERALDVFGEPVWRAAAEAAARCAATVAFAAGLRRSARGTAVADGLRLPADRSLARWIAGRRGSPTARSLARLLELPTLAARLRHLVRRLLPSPAAMRHASALARRGPVGLFLAHLARLGRHVRGMPHAVRELWEARRRTDEAAPRPRFPTGGVRLILRRGVPGLRLAVWVVRSHRRVRAQLAGGGLEAVRLPAPPSARDADRAIVAGALRRCRANCLERSLVRQRWHAAQGVSRTLVIGVTAPSSGFHAHAWLDGDPDPHRDRMEEILRRPVPPEWLRP